MCVLHCFLFVCLRRPPKRCWDAGKSTQQAYCFIIYMHDKRQALPAQNNIKFSVDMAPNTYLTSPFKGSKKKKAWEPLIYLAAALSHNTHTHTHTAQHFEHLWKFTKNKKDYTLFTPLFSSFQMWWGRASFLSKRYLLLLMNPRSALKKKIRKLTFKAVLYTNFSFFNLKRNKKTNFLIMNL